LNAKNAVDFNSILFSIHKNDNSRNWVRGEKISRVLVGNINTHIVEPWTEEIKEKRSLKQ
jgi:hypothetical protein